VYVCIYHAISLKHSGWHVFNRITQFYLPKICHPHVCPRVEWTILPYSRATKHHHSFPMQLRAGGWDGLVKMPGWYACWQWSSIPGNNVNCTIAWIICLCWTVAVVCGCVLWQRLNPAELLRLYLDYDQLAEAAELAVEYIRAALGAGKEYFGLKVRRYNNFIATFSYCMPNAMACEPGSTSSRFQGSF